MLEGTGILLVAKGDQKCVKQINALWPTGDIDNVGPEYEWS